MAKKLKKLPKKPKRTAPYSTWKRYEERVKEVQKYNRQTIAETKQKEAIIKRLQTAKNI